MDITNQVFCEVHGEDTDASTTNNDGRSISKVELDEKIYLQESTMLF